jgi:hypothetical protein
MMAGKASCDASERRLGVSLLREGPLHNAIRGIHGGINAEQVVESSVSAVSEVMQEGGLGLLGYVGRKLTGVVVQIAESKAKYQDLVEMENFHFLFHCLEKRGAKQLEKVVEEWRVEFEAVCVVCWNKA